MSAAPTACCPSCGRPVPAGELAIDRERRTVTRGGVSVYLKPAHLTILEWLAATPGRPVPSADLLDLVRRDGRDYAKGGTKLVMVLVSQLRRQLDGLGVVISSVWGVGYYLELDDPENIGVHLERRRHREARPRTAPRGSDVAIVARLAEKGLPADEIATQCGLTLRAVATAMAAATPARRAA